MSTFRPAARSRSLRAVLAAGTVVAALLVAQPSTAVPDAAPAPAAHGGDTDVYPVPQHRERRGADIPLLPLARVVSADGSDPSAVREVREILDAAGLGTARPSQAAVEVRVAGPDGAAGTGAVLDRFGVDGPSGLPGGGYVLATGRAGRDVQIVLAGADAAGQFHAAQTLRQIVTAPGHGRRPTVPAVEIRDFPDMPWRGVVEGFYGEPWSHDDRLRQIDVYGDTKLNTYLYAPKDDPFHRGRWREPYPPEQLAQLAELDDRGDEQHVDVVFTVSPGQDVCYSDPGDQAALAAKAQQVWDVGIRTFGILLDDIGREFSCARDEETFGDDASPLAAAQAELLNTFQSEFLDTHPGAGRLVTVPTEYAGNDTSTYRQRFAALLEERAVVMWTGSQVVPPEVSDADADAAAAVFDHDLLLWDNYPVNDYLPRQLFLGPLTGRSPSLHEHGVVGITANPMPQAEPSLVALGTVADYAWNPDAYEPQPSWHATIDRLGGGAADALYTFASNSRSSGLDRTESPELVAAIEAARAELDAGSPGSATAELTGLFDAMAVAPGELARTPATADLAEQAEPWLTKLRWYGEAGAAATRSLAAEAEGDGAEAWAQRVRAVAAAQNARETYETVATGVVAPYLEYAGEASRVVTADAPSTGAPGEEVTLTAEVAAGDVEVERVEWHAGTVEVGADTTAPYSMTWSDAPEGLHLITARATAADGTSVTSGPDRMVVGNPEPVLLLVGDDAPIPAGAEISTGDQAVVDRLELLGHPVEVMPGVESRTSDAEGKAAVVISSTLASSEVGAKFRDVGVPVLTWEAYVLDDMAMATAPGEAFRSFQLEVDGSSELAAGRSGLVDVYRGADRLRFGTPADGAEVAAWMPGEPSQAALFGYEPGAEMVDGAAPAARVALFLGDEGVDPDVLTGDGLALFDRAVRWALPPE